MSVRDRLLSFEKTALCIIRKWWRPFTCVWIACTMAVHGVVLPLLVYAKSGEMPTDLSGLSLLVTSIAAAFAVREYGKVKGVDQHD